MSPQAQQALQAQRQVARSSKQTTPPARPAAVSRTVSSRDEFMRRIAELRAEGGGGDERPSSPSRANSIMNRAARRGRSPDSTPSSGAADEKAVHHPPPPPKVYEESE